MKTWIQKFQQLSLIRQFVLAGGAVMVAAMLLVGQWITARIEQGVVQNSAASAALYMESFISPLSQELAHSNSLSEPARQALRETFLGTSLSERIVSYKIWKKGGLIADASDESIIGKRFEPSPELRTAWQGNVSATFESLDDPENANESKLGVPLLEVYSPIREVWTGDVIGVAEFYENADALEDEISDARRKSWMLVGTAFLGSGLLLFGIVRAGGQTIERQKRLLQAKVAEANATSEQNVLLKQRVVNASARASAQAEKTLRRIGSDLHDGPAQYMAMAAMRIEDIVPKDVAGQEEAETIRDAINAALSEIRTISRGLAHPDLDQLDIEAIIQSVVESSERHSHRKISFEFNSVGKPSVDYGQKLCLFRFVQEGLSNSAKHAKDAKVRVDVAIMPDAISATIADTGPGFDPSHPEPDRIDGGLGLTGLNDRAESLGGSITIISGSGKGTTLTLSLPLQKEDSL